MGGVELLKDSSISGAAPAGLGAQRALLPLCCREASRCFPLDGCKKVEAKEGSGTRSWRRDFEQHLRHGWRPCLWRFGLELVDGGGR
mmetsp:Transcript_92981/g.248869  ORF Transcript_92981/g.248869 Transcript_92981/m.248869 type:complete len:87 (+) Transcript_92981:356-616(+)